MVTLEVYPARDLPSPIKWQILSFLRIVWWDGFAGANRLRDWISRPERHSRHFVLTEAGLLISHAQVVWDELGFLGETYKVYGLTGVLTYPAERHHGYGRQVVQAATAYIDTTDADFAIVNCSPHLRDFYAACGWLPMIDTQTMIGDPSQPLVSEEILLMRFYSEKGHRARPALAGRALYVGDSVW